MEKLAEFPCVFVVFGATGDLTHRKLIPALYNLWNKNLLDRKFALLAVARKEKTDEEFRKEAFEDVKSLKKFNKKTWDELSSHIYYYRKDFSLEDSYSELYGLLSNLDTKHDTKGNRIFYLATLPDNFGSIVNNLKKHNLIDRKSDKIYRIVIEKPFGNDLKSANELNKELTSVFRENEIYRIDHYLGKEAVQNLFALRFANRIFEAIWDSKHIDNIQITVAESLGVENRGNYYDKFGALKDMVQNHLLQILSIVAMEPPKSFSTEDVKSEKIKVLKAIKTGRNLKENTVFGQYNGKFNYTQETGVDPKSRTETYLALKLDIDNPRWKNVPFYLRTGKYLKGKASEVVVYLKDTDVKVFSENTKPNVLVVRLQPNEGIYLRFNIKEPGNDFKIEEVSMDFCHECLFIYNTPEAYEKLIYDIFMGDLSLFSRWDEVEEAWKIIDPIAEYWKNSKELPYFYEPGSWGPPVADDIPGRYGRHWREPM